MKLSIIPKLFFLFVVFAITSCKKEANKDNIDSYLKFKMNGQWITYQAVGELGPDLMTPSKTDLGVTGWSDDKTTTFDLSIQIDGSDFKTGSYSTDDSRYYMVINYLYFPADVSKVRNYENEDAYGKEPCKYTIKITSITPDRIKGTFTGNYLYDYFHDDDPDGGILNITEGEFHVKRIR